MQTHQPVEAWVRNCNTSVVGIDCAEGEVLSWNGQLGEGVEQRGLANVGQAHDSHLQKQDQLAGRLGWSLQHSTRAVRQATTTTPAWDYM